MIKKLLEENGVQFELHSGQMVSRITLATLERVERELRERLLQELSWEAHCAKNELEDGEFAGASRICSLIDNKK